MNDPTAVARVLAAAIQMVPPPAAEMSYNCGRGFPVVVPLLAYDDLGAALEWLARVFGFAEQ